MARDKGLGVFSVEMTVNTVRVDELTYQEHWVQDGKGQHFKIRKKGPLRQQVRKILKSTRRTEDVTVFTD